jgi:N-acyl-D-amino-acid deacylase
MGKANWSKFERFQEMARAARSEGVDVGFDAVTYVAWTGDLVALLPHVVGAQGREAVVALANTQSGRSYLRAEVARHAPTSPAWSPGAVTRNLPLEIGWDNLRIADPASERFAPYAGLSVAEAAEKEGSDVFDCYCDWVVGSSGRGRALIVGFSGDFADERPLEELLSDPSAIPGTDTAADRNAHDSLELTLPLFYGTMPRFIGHFRRDRCLFSLEEGVKRMTSMPAERVGLRDRGLLKVGNKADVTVFDPSTIDDQGDYFQPKRPRGIEYVLVNGQPVVKAGAADVERLAGQVLRSARPRGMR